ncbi:MAG: hypothetical protein KatS3mg076_0245 [Candidatus Binatia bacterium]|nr:MAG: hypothetical protein KatS3mg076_0245 [Candidatus Binatia bacterium]
MTKRSLAFLVALAWFCWAGSPPTSGQPLPRDPRQELERLDAEILAKQRALFAARQRGDEQEIRRLTEEFREIQKKRARVISRARHLF